MKKIIFFLIVFFSCNAVFGQASETGDVTIGKLDTSFLLSKSKTIEIPFSVKKSVAETLQKQVLHDVPGCKIVANISLQKYKNYYAAGVNVKVFYEGDQLLSVYRCTGQFETALVDSNIIGDDEAKMKALADVTDRVIQHLNSKWNRYTIEEFNKLNDMVNSPALDVKFQVIDALMAYQYSADITSVYITPNYEFMAEVDNGVSTADHKGLYIMLHQIVN